MTPRDWDFAFGDLGDPLLDIEWWMTYPLPEWMLNKEDEDDNTGHDFRVV